MKPITSHFSAGLASVACVVSLFCSGCGAAPKSMPSVAPAPTPPARTVVVPEPLTPPAAVVRFVNAESRFVVIDFGPNRLPGMGDELVVMRGTTKAGKVRITPPSRGSLVTADILEGTVAVGDTLP